MINIDYIYKRKNGGTIECYGDIEEDSNFIIACDNENYDTVACSIDTNKYNTWRRVCKYLDENYRHDIEQIETC